MLPMYGEHCLSCQAVHNWVQKFSEGRTSIEDEHRAGRPVEIATPETLQRVEDIIRAERRVSRASKSPFYVIHTVQFLIFRIFKNQQNALINIK